MQFEREERERLINQTAEKLEQNFHQTKAYEQSVAENLQMIKNLRRQRDRLYDLMEGRLSKELSAEY